jgi:hypothetical protein
VGQPGSASEFPYGGHFPAMNGVCAGQRGVTRAGGTGCKTVGSAYVGSNPTPATRCENAPLAAKSRASGAFPLCPVMCHLVALWIVMLRCPRTYSGRLRQGSPATWPGGGRGAGEVATAAHDRLPVREYRPAGGVVRLYRHREGVAAYRGRVRGPRAGRSAARSPGRPARDCPLPGVEGLRPVFRSGWGRSAEMAGRLPGFANCREPG